MRFLHTFMSSAALLVRAQPYSRKAASHWSEALLHGLVGAGVAALGATLFSRSTARRARLSEGAISSRLYDELRGPLVSILNPTEKLLAGAGLNEGQRCELEIVRSNAHQLLERIGELVEPWKRGGEAEFEPAAQAPPACAENRERELATALASVRVAREQADTASRVKDSFLGMVSHELRTPVTTFQLQIERLRRACAEPDPRQQELIARMATTARRMATLVESLLQYARIQSGGLKATPQTFDARDVVREVAEELRAQAEAKGLTIELESGAPCTLLHSDPELVRLVLVNLTGNAIKFTERGRVELGVAHGKREVRLTVSDTGPGIAPEEQVRIFEPFEHIEPTRHKHTPGVGLGLALVRELAGALGGRVDLSSEPGCGSVFTVCLPSAVP